ncbi:hypothetical protein HGO38_28880 [Rhizobium sp. CG5]|uniref:hypothetical protein n=1 Tax=Rhizobium sp. CG5 TaxID=2726076 RepID=UPI0020349D37|nr:hypothetical protein [Rhizobium sp. CG5]MCM2477466.1 hypothetical protein [Rhizobium sp. CG5]
MSAEYKVIIKNMSNDPTSFYAFQQQASFSGSGSGAVIRSSSLATGPLAPNATSGAQLEFGFDVQIYAGAICRNPDSSFVTLNVTLSRRTVTDTVSLSAAAQPITLTVSGTDTTANDTTLSIDPLGLSTPTHQTGMATGSFGIEIPTFSPGTVEDLYCGCAAMNHDGSSILSSFLSPKPSSQLSCAPLPIYYVKTGSIPVGQIVTYDTGNAGECDFSKGSSVLTAEYNIDGTFTITEAS